MAPSRLYLVPSILICWHVKVEDQETCGNQSSYGCSTDRLLYLVPRHESLVPRYESLVPRYESLVPRFETLVPKLESLVPKHESLMQLDFTAYKRIVLVIRGAYP